MCKTGLNGINKRKSETLEDGAIYEGEMLLDKPHGYGKKVWLDG